MDTLRKEIEVYDNHGIYYIFRDDDTLKGLSFKFKIGSTKKEESIKNLKNLVKEKQKIFLTITSEVWLNTLKIQIKN